MPALQENGSKSRYVSIILTRYKYMYGKMIRCLDTRSPAQSAYTLILKKPTDLDLHCLSFSMWIYIHNVD